MILHTTILLSQIGPMTNRRAFLLTPPSLAVVQMVLGNHPSPALAANDPKSVILPDVGDIEASIPIDWNDIENPFM